MKLLPDHARAVTGVTRGQVCDDGDDRWDLTAGSPAADALPAQAACTSIGLMEAPAWLASGAAYHGWAQDSLRCH